MLLPASMAGSAEAIGADRGASSWMSVGRESHQCCQQKKIENSSNPDWGDLAVDLNLRKDLERCC